MIEFQLLAGLRGVEKSIPNDNNLFPFTFDVGGDVSQREKLI